MHGRRLPSIMLYDHAGAFWRKGGTPGSWAQPENPFSDWNLLTFFQCFYCNGSSQNCYQIKHYSDKSVHTREYIQHS